MNHQMLIGKIPSQIGSSFQSLQGMVLAYRNNLIFQRNQESHSLVILTPQQFRVTKRCEMFNWSVHLHQSDQIFLSIERFREILDANHFILGDLYKANSLAYINQKYRSWESYLQDESIINLLIDFQDMNQTIIQFKKSNPSLSPFTGTSAIYCNINNPFVTYVVYDSISLDDSVQSFYAKLIKNKAFETMQDAKAYYKVFDESLTVEQLLFDQPSELGNVIAFRANYSRMSRDLAFTAYTRHIQQFHPNCDFQTLSANRCPQCMTQNHCSLSDVNPLKQPQLVPIESLHQYPIPKQLMDFWASIYAALICQMKIWAHQDSISQALGLDISQEAFTTSQANSLQNYENLELLGDSVLKYVVSCEYFLHYEELDEGQMTQLRSSVVKNEFLASLFVPFSAYVLNQDMHFRQIRCPFLKDLIYSDGDPELQQSQMADLYEAFGGDIFHKTQSLFDFIDYLRRTNFPISKLDHEILKFKSLTVEEGDCQNQELLLNYEFKNRQLLEMALNNYERLEFLGDAALELLFVNYIYNGLKEKSPGRLTELKGVYLSNQFMGRLAIEMGLVRETQEIPKMYGDIFESVAAAVLLDGGWDALNKVYGRVYRLKIQLNNVFI